MSIRISKAEFLQQHKGRRSIDYAKVKEWILSQGDNAIPIATIEQKFNLRFTTLTWRAKQEGDRITSGAMEREGKKIKMFVLEVGVSQPAQRKRKTPNGASQPAEPRIRGVSKEQLMEERYRKAEGQPTKGEGLSKQPKTK